MRAIYVTFALVGLWFSPVALQAVPAEQTVTFSIYETPTDPSSNVVFEVEMTLVPDLIEANFFGPDGEVGWEVTSVQFTEVTSSGNVIWSESYPVVDTLYGLWWVTHADLDNVDIAEFVLPPLIAGTAAPDDPNDDDLDYSYVGQAYTPPPSPEEPPHPVTAALDYTFQLAMAAEPTETGTDEPASTNGPIDPD